MRRVICPTLNKAVIKVLLHKMHPRQVTVFLTCCCCLSIKKWSKNTKESSIKTALFLFYFPKKRTGTSHCTDNAGSQAVISIQTTKSSHRLNIMLFRLQIIHKFHLHLRNELFLTGWCIKQRSAHDCGDLTSESWNFHVKF